MTPSDSLLQAILEESENALGLFDRTGALKAASRGLALLLGLDDRPVGQDLLSRLEAGSRSAESAGEPSLPADPRFRLTHWSLPDGRKIPLRYRIKPLVGGEWQLLILEYGGVGGYNGACDIEDNFRAIFETALDAVVVIDDQGLIRSLNPATEKQFGFTKTELQGQSVDILLASAWVAEQPLHAAGEANRTPETLIGEAREVMVRRKDGSHFPATLSVGECHHGGQSWLVAIFHDLTSRWEREEKLLLFSRVVEQSPAGILITNLESQVEYVNHSFVRLTGYQANRIEGRELRWLVEDFPAIASETRLWRCFDARQEWRGEIQDRKLTGEPYWALVSFTPIRDVHGEITRYLVRFQDITSQKRSQQALEESENRFRVVAKMVGEWLWEQDAYGRYTYSSSAVEDILGYGAEEILGMHYLELMTESDRDLWTSSPRVANQLKKPFSKLINRYRHRDGHVVFTESTGSPVLGERGETLKWRGMDLDITARKRAEDELRLRDRAIEAARVGIAIGDARLANFPTIYVNPALCRISGYSRRELLGQSLKMLQGEETNEPARSEIREALIHGRNCEVTIRNYRKDGTAFWNELLLSPVHDDQGRLTHYIGIIADVSERRRSEEARHELEIAKQIQMSLLPKRPLSLDRVQLAGVCLPAEQVGGDYYDFFCHGELTDVVIADVSGHSVGAALIMSEMRSTLKAVIRRYQTRSASTVQILSVLNEMLYDDLTGSDLFITMFFMRLNRETGELTYANAGHNPPLLLRRDASRCQGLDAEGLILGVHRQVEFEEKRLRLEAGDRLLLYTDGVTEMQDMQGEFFGMERLCHAFCDHRAFSPEETLSRLTDGLNAFRDKQTIQDDVTMVAMQFTE